MGTERRRQLAAHGADSLDGGSGERPAASRAPLVSAQDRRAIRRAIIRWFGKAQRALPWRETYAPYGVWISEIMLQQTQVETVRPYYERWMTRFPSVQSVSEAPLEAVLKLWEGLGYYSRARSLHKAATVVMTKHGGRIPGNLAELAALPGVGRYTAGAIYSIGFNRPAPIVDGNVGRVLGRMVALESPARSAAGQKYLWALAGELVPKRNPRDFNQGLMELGALVCRPKDPGCLLCPIHAHCVAHGQGNPQGYPPAAARKIRPQRYGSMLLALDAQGRVLLRQREANGIWGGLWEPPWVEHDPHLTKARAARLLLEEAGLAPNLSTKERGRVTHGLTHFALSLALVRVRVPQPLSDCSNDGSMRWVDAEQATELPLARLGRKALANVFATDKAAETAPQRQ